jgi:phosphatidylglycerol:prolipoprotein diacylglycerol transferase
MSIYLAYITWNPSPSIFHIGTWGLGWYSLMWALSVLLGYMQTAAIYKREGIATGYASVLAEYIFFGGLIGARLGQVFFYDFAYFMQTPSEIIKVWHGGLSSHGGAIGIFLSSYLFLRRYPHISYIRLLDILAMGAPFVGMLIRIGNLFNSEIVGKVTQVPWAFIFENNGDTFARHPSALYEAIMLGSVWLLLLYLYRYRHLPTGMLTALFFILSFSLRFLLEFLKADAQLTQWLNIPFIIIGLLIAYWAKNNKFATAGATPTKTV